MDKEINSFSVSDIFWLQIKKCRISFRFQGLPKHVHFTISWHENSNKVNFHVTNNAGDQSHKPKIVVAEFEKQIAEQFLSFVPEQIFKYLFKPFSLKKYSRRLRKQARLFFLANDETQTVEKKFSQIFDTSGFIKGQRFKMNDEVENKLYQLARSPEIQLWIKKNMKVLGRKKFQTRKTTAGLMLLRRKVVPFICHNGNAYMLNDSPTLYGMLCSFMKAELAMELIELTNEAIENVKNAKSFEDTPTRNHPPYTLYVGQNY